MNKICAQYSRLVAMDFSWSVLHIFSGIFLKSYTKTRTQFFLLYTQNQSDASQTTCAHEASKIWFMNLLSLALRLQVGHTASAYQIASQKYYFIYSNASNSHCEILSICTYYDINGRCTHSALYMKCSDLYTIWFNT